MQKNVASQKVQLFAFDITTGAPKTGDAANITAYVSKDHGAVTVLGDTSASEMDATNAKGVYLFDLTQGETNADELTFTAKSSTSNVSITPRFITTTYASFSANVAQTGDNYARIGAPAGASVSADIAAVKAVDDAIKAKTDNLPAAPASTTNITAGTITTVTNLTNAPTAGDLTATMKTSVTTAATAATPVAASVTGAVGSVTGNVGGNVVGSVASVAGAVGSVTGNVGGNVTGSVGSVVGAVGSVTGLTASDVGAIKAVTDKLDDTVAIDSDGNYQFTADALAAAPIGGSGGLDAAGVRAAIGMASANLDTQLGDLPTAAENADAIWDEAVDGATTARQSIRLHNSALGGKASGLATTNAIFRDLADTKDRIDATVDADGNRTAVTTDLT